MSTPIFRSALLVMMTIRALAAVDLTVTPDRPDGIYQPGDKVTWTVTAKPAQDALKYQVKSGGLTSIAEGELHFVDGKTTVTATAEQPGTLLLVIPHDGVKSYGGAVFAWERIAPSAPRPVDFDAFWKSKLTELQAVPAAPRLEKVESGIPHVEMWKITMDNIRGTKIHGYLARPEGDAPCPAVLMFQAAGVNPIPKEWLGSASRGWLTLFIGAHNLPVDESKAYYAEQGQGPLKNYAAIGNDDRETSYFLRMFLACYRAADYLTQRSDWNHVTLHVEGGSQGGFQALVTAALHPAVTDVTAHLPAGCDHTAALAQRAPCWPAWIQIGGGKDSARVTTASTYYDVVNFASRITCPTLIGAGLIDITCPPSAVIAMFNQISAPKRIVIMPLIGHESGPRDLYHSIQWEWQLKARDGKPLPLK